MPVCVGWPGQTAFVLRGIGGLSATIVRVTLGHGTVTLQAQIMAPNQDIEHIRLLSIFHYVVAGIIALVSLFPAVHLALGIAMLTGALDDFDKGNPPPEFFGWMFVILPAMFIVGGLMMAVCVAIAGRQLARHGGYTYCLVIAGVECLFMPFGTVLGVFTILVLIRPTVKSLFATEIA